MKKIINLIKRAAAAIKTSFLVHWNHEETEEEWWGRQW